MSYKYKISSKTNKQNAVVYDVKLKKLHLIQNLRKPGLRMQIVVKPEPQSMIISVFSQSSLDQIIRKRRSAFCLLVLLDILYL